MSYCRNTGTDSDVYVILGRKWECVGCSLSDGEWGTTCDDREDMIAHLKRHQDAGDKVPERAFERLRREIAEEAQE